MPDFKRSAARAPRMMAGAPQKTGGSNWATALLGVCLAAAAIGAFAFFYEHADRLHAFGLAPPSHAAGSPASWPL